MKLEFNTLYWNNTPVEQMDAHRRVTDYFNIPVNYHGVNIPHGAWMDRVCRESKSDIIGFFDADCVPVSYDEVMNCVRYVQTNRTFIGVAQVSNHIHPKSHIYAAPAFYLIHKEAWENINTSFSETRRSDVAEEITYRAEEIGMRYRCLYPSTFEREPVEGVWPLGNYGYYGVGTTFESTVYHLYQGRMGNNLQLFIDRCDEIVNDTFDNRLHTCSTTMNYKGRIVP